MYEYTKRIRDFINRPRKQYVLSKNPGPWNQLCSSLDVIEDSDLAIEAHSTGDYGSTIGAVYLAVYGLLQALYLQQDAVFNLCESLGLHQYISDYPRLENIRDIRNMSTGHPTKKDRPKSKPSSYHFISRGTLSAGGFDLHSSFSDGRHEIRNVSLKDLIAHQRSDIISILDLVIGKLERDEAAHKENFRMEKLASLFDDPLNYQVGKVFEGIDAARGLLNLPPAVGEIGLQYVKERLQAFRDALAKRGEHDAYEGRKDSYELLEYSLDELEKFFRDVKNGVESNINEKAARIFAFFIHKQVAELRQIAEDIDRDYSS